MGAVCIGGTCVCGGAGQPCCPTAPACGGGLVCGGGVCRTNRPPVWELLRGTTGDTCCTAAIFRCTDPDRDNIVTNARGDCQLQNFDCGWDAGFVGSPFTCESEIRVEAGGSSCRENTFCTDQFGAVSNNISFDFSF